jgi:MFS superfamily sulfate permease-like transporter
VNISRFVPILSWLPHYDRTWLTFDVIAGLTLWGLVVPEGMAYAGIAGLPPQAGLYTLTISLLVYALLGTSRHLSVGGTSATAALLASSVAAALVGSASATASDSTSYQTYAAAFVLVSGLVFLVAGVARLGFITQCLSRPVMDVAVACASAHAPVLERARETGLLGAIGGGRVFPTVDLAVRAIEAQPSAPPSAPGEGDRAGVQP